jgi:hypothetical protein
VADERTPSELREQVRSGITEALARDAELRGGRTARLLAAAGAVGAFGAIGMVRMVSAHPYDHHPAWHLAVFAALWSGLLVVTLTIAFLQVRTPSLPLARATRVGLVGLGVAGICSALCPDQHFLAWWSATRVGRALDAVPGIPLGALCFGGVTSLVFGSAAAFAALGGGRRGSIRPLLPAAMLVLLLMPGIALQSVGTSWAVFASWLLGTAAGAYTGVAIGIGVRARLGFA